MSRTAKSKPKWRFYTGEIHNRYVDPSKFKRLYAPLDNILTWQAEFQGYCVTLRPCEEGVSTDGEQKAVLYCTENHNRFFYQDKDGFWNEQRPGYCPDRPNKKTGGCASYTYMTHRGSVLCHLLVAHAWVENRYNYIVEVWNEKKGRMEKVCTRQIDHLDTNTLNNNADNLEYVTAAENRRRRKITDHLKNKAGIDPKRLTPLLMRGIFSLPEGSIPMLVEQYLKICANDKSQMLIENIRINVAMALDSIKSTIKDN